MELEELFDMIILMVLVLKEGCLGSDFLLNVSAIVLYLSIDRAVII